MKIKILFFSLALFLGTFNLALATPSLVPLRNASETAAYDTGNYELNDFVEMGVNVTKIILGTVGSLTLMMFIYGGVMMMISSGSSEKVSQAKGIIMAAVVGLVIVFASYIIIKFVVTALGSKSAGSWQESGINISF